MIGFWPIHFRFVESFKGSSKQANSNLLIEWSDSCYGFLIVICHMLWLFGGGKLNFGNLVKSSFADEKELSFAMLEKFALLNLVINTWTAVN